MISFIEKPDFLFISKGNDSNNPSNGEGNVTAETIGFDSQLPRMPDGYTFDFVIDLSDTKPSGFDYKNVPLSVTLVKRELYEPDKEETAKGIYRVKLNNDGTKRIWLRDALRFDFDIPYSKTNGEDPSSITAELPILIIEGGLNNADMQELSALVKNAKVITLDLTNATWDGMAIPDNFADGATLLKEVKLPTVNGIGSNAFKGCTGLENINEMLNNVIGSIGNSAFEECTNEKFNALIIPNTVSGLGNKAFANDRQLTKVTVPSSYNQETADRIIPSCADDAFHGINANNCEVEFTGEDERNNYQEYRKQEGWMYLLTKDLDDMKVYNNVYQSHADAVASRTFNSNGWYSVAYPFDVNAETLLSVKDENDNAVFSRAATLWSDDFHLENYPTAYFRYLNNTGDLSDWEASGKKEVIEAGKPFIVKVANKRSDNKYIFKDVTTYPSKDKEGYSDAKYNWNGEEAITGSFDQTTSFEMKANFYTDALSVDKDKWFMSDNKTYHGGTNAKLRPYRSFFYSNSPEGQAKLAAFFTGDWETTGIKDIICDSAENGNIYNLNGQLVRTGNNSVKGLAKGVYIVNGKRVVVK